MASIGCWYTYVYYSLKSPFLGAFLVIHNQGVALSFICDIISHRNKKAGNNLP